MDLLTGLLVFGRTLFFVLCYMFPFIALTLVVMLIWTAWEKRRERKRIERMFDIKYDEWRFIEQTPDHKRRARR